MRSRVARVFSWADATEYELDQSADVPELPPRLSRRQKRRAYEDRYWGNVLKNARRWLEKFHRRKSQEEEAILEEYRELAERCVARVSHIDVAHDGQYLLLYQEHFVAFRILENQAEINFTHRSHTWHSCLLSECNEKPVEYLPAVSKYVVDASLMDGLFRICDDSSSSTGSDLQGGSGLSEEHTGRAIASSTWVRICMNRAEALKRKRLGDLVSQDVAGFGCKENPDTATISGKREQALARRIFLQVYETSMPPSLIRFCGTGGVRLPLPDAGWQPQDLQGMPHQFMLSGQTDIAFDFLKQKHPHRLDEHLAFDPVSHRYYIDGVPTDTSVTGFIARFQHPFDANEVIARMQQQGDWPRENYLQLAHTSKYFSSYNKNMLDELSHIPSSSGWKYRLQLNMYKFILEKYYDVLISRMLVVSIHPDCVEAPFVDEVPDMQPDVCSIMERRRTDWCADLQGGSSSGMMANAMDIKHAFTGSFVMKLAMSDETVVLDWARRWISEVQNVPAFATMFFSDSGQEIPPALTWSELDHPSQVLLVLKPVTLSFTEALFEAIEASDLPGVRDILSQGQDPNCVLVDAALTFACLYSSREIVQSLLLGNANPDFIPPARSSALHVATCTGRSDLVDLLLGACADPDVWDSTNCSTPAHDAACTGRSHILELLLEWGADPMLQDGDGDNVSLCHVTAIVEFVPEEAFLRVSSRLAKQMKFFSYVFDGKGGSSGMDCESDDGPAPAERPPLLEPTNASVHDPMDDLDLEPVVEEAIGPGLSSQVKAEGDPAGGQNDEDVEVDIDGDDVAEETWRKLKKRRLMPGALTSDDDFNSHFQKLFAADAEFQKTEGEVLETGDTILHLTKAQKTDLKRKFTGFSDYMVRFASAAVCVFCLRAADIHFREHAMVLWIIEGGAHLRFHQGDCYMLHPSGAFERYKGIPPDCGRVHLFLMRLEGLFRRLPQGLPRTPDDLSSEINRLWQQDGHDDSTFLDNCLAACVSNAGESLLKKPARGEDAGGEENSAAWHIHVARMITQLKRNLIRELSEEKLINYMIEWCDTPKLASSGCCYEDCCILLKENDVAKQARFG
eukprot:Skav234405  [mRNA]  locus=scaffold873:368159:373264:+ [translate_table: standard]